jgi:nucleoside-diphosphate-sugar epimerase
MAEGLVTRSGLPYTILRISGIAVPAFLEPPQVWPFMEEQRMEFVCRDDVMTAVTNCVGNKEARGEVFNIAGGEHWRMTGREYVKSLFDVMGVAPEAASYLEGPGWFDWYHTADSQAVLDYQKTTFRDYLNRIEQSLKELMG